MANNVVAPPLMLTMLRTPQRFNRVCYALAALWLLVVVPFTLTRPTPQRDASAAPDDPMSLFGSVGMGDFPQFYMGGLMARLRAWDSLYPIPNPGSVNNPGMPDDSTMRPRYAAEAERRDVGDRVRFIQAPPVALLLEPVSWVGFHRSFQAWTLMLIVSGWGLGFVAARIYETVQPVPSRAAGLIALLVCTSPIMLHSIRIANMTVPIGLCIGVGTLQLVRRKPMSAGLAIMLGTVTKYATLPLLPLALCMRRFRALAWAAVSCAALFAVTYAIAGPTPFRIYSNEIAPTLSRPHRLETNQSLAALVTRVAHQRGVWRREQFMPQPWKLTISAIALATFGIILYAMARKPRRAWEEDPASAYAAAAALTGALLIFAPIFWEHYAVYLCPFWGWMLWEGWRSKGKLVLAVLGIALMYVPWTYLRDWPEPYNTHMLPGAVAIVVMATWTLVGRGQAGSQVESA